MRKAIKANKNSDYGFFNVQRIPVTPRSVAEASGWVEVHRIAIAYYSQQNTPSNIQNRPIDAANGERSMVDFAFGTLYDISALAEARG